MVFYYAATTRPNVIHCNNICSHLTIKHDSTTPLQHFLSLSFTEGFLSCFSLYYTIGKLTAPGTDDEISCIHGVRGLATIALLIAHKFLPVAVMPYTNRLRITEVRV